MRVEDLSNGYIEEHSTKGSSAPSSGAGGKGCQIKRQKRAAC